MGAFFEHPQAGLHSATLYRSNVATLENFASSWAEPVPRSAGEVLVAYRNIQTGIEKGSWFVDFLHLAELRTATGEG